MGYMFKRDLEPIALIDENICILSEGGRTYYKVVAIEAVPEIIKDFGAITAGGETEYTDMTELKVGKNKLGHYRILPLDNIYIYAKQPSATQKWDVQRTTARISQRITDYNPTLSLTEVFQHEDQPFEIKVVNPDTVDIDKSRILFYGFVYKLSKLTEKPAQYTVAQVVSLPACGGE